MAFDDSLILAEHYAAVREHLDAIARVAPRDLDGSGALALFDAAYEFGDRFAAIATRALPVVETDVVWATEARTFPWWVSRRVHITHYRAQRMTRLGRALRDELPLTGAAVVTGGPERLTLDQAEILTTCAATSPGRREALLDPTNVCGERFLLTQAHAWPADKFRNAVKRWAAATDPDADERGFKEATDREYLDIALTTGGYFLNGFLTTEHGQLLLTGLDALIRTPSKDEIRTRAQLRAEALVTMTRLSLDNGLVGTTGGVKPHLNIHVGYRTLLALAAQASAGDGAGDRDQVPGDLLPVPYAPGHITGLEHLTGPGSMENGEFAAAGLLDAAMFEDGQPVPWAVLSRILCDGELSRIVFGPDGQILNVGRKKRTYRKHLRRAIIARDKHCQYPTCDAPARLCECHHSKHWGRDHGDTDVATGVLLCWHHHTHVHNNGIEIAWKSGGGWVFTDRHGRTVLRN
ncbi:HNH endonuclease signature motif containing protein [Pengzhenrongella sp.]|uniref:HNH endonuclease signature motif containing protein n=1 Tax=Pengzhenrongella sp. TaxID=2888820 RepID=UPI002F923D2C